MLRKFVSAAIVVVLFGGFSLAAEIQGTAKKMTVEDGKVKSITVVTKVDDKDVEKVIICTDKTEFVGGRKGGKTLELEAVIKMATNVGKEITKDEKTIKFEPRVTVTTDDDGKATKVQFRGGRRKGKTDTE